jgi:hypothetical protein
MARVPKLVLIVIILSALVSCGIFFTPMDGRWNTADPKSELLTFDPIVSGYVQNVAPAWVDTGTLLAYPGSKIILLRFDTGDFPNVVANSYLRLTVQDSPSCDAELSIYRMTSDVDPKTLVYDELTRDPVTLYDASEVTKFLIYCGTGYDEQFQIPLTEVFTGKKEDLANGILIFSSENIGFYPAGDSATAPVLLVEPE